MIEIAQAGQAGKAMLLFDMHRLRARVFKDRLKWDVAVDENGLEADQFDMPGAAYILALDDARRVIGSWRLLPATGPTMIRDVWPQFLRSLPMPDDDAGAWEVSRFSIDAPAADPAQAAALSQRAVAEMFCALTETCILCGIREIYTLYDDRIARVIERIDCAPERTSDVMPIDGQNCRTGVFRTDRQMLQRLRRATGVKDSLIAHIELPPVLQQRISPNQETAS